MAAAPVYSLDAGTINRERMNNMYNPLSLMVAISVAHLPFVLMLAFLSITPVYWIGAESEPERYFAQVLIFFVHLYWWTFATMLGVLITNFIAAIGVMASIISMFCFERLVFGDNLTGRRGDPLRVALQVHLGEPGLASFLARTSACASLVTPSATALGVTPPRGGQQHGRDAVLLDSRQRGLHRGPEDRRVPDPEDEGR